MIVHIIRADGKEEHVEHTGHDLASLIGADFLDHFMKDRTHIVFVDDLGHSKNLPINEKATKMYWDICIPGTVVPIVGDVVIVEEDPDAEDQG